MGIRSYSGVPMMPDVSEAAASLPAEGFCRLESIIGTRDRPGPLPISRASWYEGIKEGRYPKPRKEGARSLWSVADVRAVLARIEAA